MNEKDNLEIVNIQLAFFFKNEFKGAINDISDKIKENKFGLSDQINFVTEKDEFGKITGNTIATIKNEDETEENVNIAYTISNNRFDMYIPHSRLIEIIKTNLEKIFTIFQTFDININRLGLVIYYGNTSINKSDFVNLFTKINIEKDKLDNLSEINLLINLKKNFSFKDGESIIINDRTQYLTSSKKENGISLPGFIIMRDVNTAPENKSLVINSSKSIYFIDEAEKITKNFLFS